MTETKKAQEALEQRLALRRRLPAPAMRRALRQASGLSAAEVAACLGVSRQAVAQWERGARTPRGIHLELYVAILDRLARDVRSAS